MALRSDEELIQKVRRIADKSGKSVGAEQVAQDLEPIRASSEEITPPAGDADIDLSVPRFNQNNPLWKNDPMGTTSSNGTGYTIGNQGCLLTSSAMVFCYYGCSSITPRVLNSSLGVYACPLYYERAAGCSGGTARWYGLHDFTYPRMFSYLNSGYPPILCLEKLVAGKRRTHWVTVKRVSGDGNIAASYWVNDPWDGLEKRLGELMSRGGWTTCASLAVYSRLSVRPASTSEDGDHTSSRTSPPCRPGPARHASGRDRV